MRLTTVGERIAAAIECSECAANIRVTGNTFAEIAAKLAANTNAEGEPKPIMVDDGPATCQACQRGEPAADKLVGDAGEEGASDE